MFGIKYQLREHVGVYYGGKYEGHFYGGEGEIINNEFEETDRFDAVENNQEVPELDEKFMNQLIEEKKILATTMEYLSAEYAKILS